MTSPTPVKPLMGLALLALACALPVHADPDGVRVTLIKTADARVREALMVAGGDWSQERVLNHIAVLVEHPRFPDQRLMFDAGLSAAVETERQTNLPWLYRQWPLLSYAHLNPARQQLPAGLYPKVIALSHIHWDHASGIADFPEAEVWAAPAERAFAGQATPPAVFPTQVRSQAPRWKDMVFTARPQCGFAQSQDVYGDGSVVLVSMPGHTPGSVGLWVRTGQGRKLLFVGDTVWLRRAVDEHLAKPLISRSADALPAQVLDQIERLAACVRADPAVEIIPAHDAAAQDVLSYFPNWVN